MKDICPYCTAPDGSHTGTHHKPGCIRRAKTIKELRRLAMDRLKVMTHDEAANTVTAFRTYAELKAACQTGYVPTLINHPGDSRDELRARDMLVSQLKSDGFTVRDRQT